VYRLAEIPSGFFADEASIGYNAYAILNTGKDEYGVSYPVFFKGFGDYKHPIAIYSTIPFIKFLSLNETSVRLQAVFYGIISLVLLYLIGEKIASKTLGLWTAFVAATMPWLVHYNRVAFDFTVYSAFFLCSIYLLLKSVQSKYYIIPFFTALAFTFYTYQPAKLIVPLLLIGSLLIYRETFLKHIKISAVGIGLFLIVSIPLIHSFTTREATARFNMVSIFTSKLTPRETIKKAIDNYFVQLTPVYFFTRGEPTFITRHFVGGLTPLLITNAPFLLIGFFILVKDIKQKYSQLLLYWLVIYPIGGAITAEGPFTARTIIGAPLAALFISLGTVALIQYLSKVTNVNTRIPNYILQLVLLANLYVFLQFYFVKYPLYSSDFWGWQYGARDIAKYFVSQQSKYDELIMAPEFNSPEIFFKFYAPNDCNKCRIGLPDTNYNPLIKQLFAVTPKYLHERPYIKFKTQKTIYYPNGTIAFQIGEIKE